MSLALVTGWFVAVLLLAALAFPLAALAFPDWPDRGASVAPAVGLAILTLVGFWVGQVTMGAVALLAGIAVLFAGLALAVRGGVALRPRRSFLAPLVVFTGAFLLVVLVRAVDPGVTPYAGEQFLDFGLIHTVRRTASLPPQDLWFAGDPLRYYYGGPLLTGLLTWLTDTPPRYAYNLMVPTLFAALVTAAYGLTGAIAAARGTSHRLAGLLGAFFVAFAGTVATPLRGLASYVPGDLAAEYGRVLFGAIRQDYPDAVESARFLDGGEFSYWLGRYVIPETPNVFPFWTYVNGDLRPHMYAGPFFLLAVALAFAFYRTPAADRTRRVALLVGAVPATGGLLAVTNTFDLPAVVGVVWLATLFADAAPATLLPQGLRGWLPDARSRVATEGRRLLASVLLSGVVALVAVLWAAPMLLGNTPDNRGVSLLGPTSNLGGLLLVFGGFLAAFALWLTPRIARGWSRRRRGAVAVALLGVLGLTTLVGYPAVGLFVPVGAGGWWLLRTGRVRSFAVVLVVAGAGLALVPEFAYADIWPYDPNAPRWNTVYKLTLQVWTLWGVAAGVALAAVFDRARDLAGAGFGTQGSSPATVGATLAAVVVLVLAGTFPAFAVASQVDDATGPDGDLALSLNATAGPAESQPADLAAARWLREETTGQPTMVSKPAGRDIYNWDGGANVPSTFSGVPTVVGWEHVAGYHGIGPFEERISDVERFYTGNAAEVREFVRRYDVQYIYVGPAEREAYGPRDFAVEFSWIDEVYRHPDVSIYEVDRAALDETAST